MRLAQPVNGDGVRDVAAGHADFTAIIALAAQLLSREGDMPASLSRTVGDDGGTFTLEAQSSLGQALLVMTVTASTMSGSTYQYGTNRFNHRMGLLRTNCGQDPELMSATVLENGLRILYRSTVPITMDIIISTIRIGGIEIVDVQEVAVEQKKV